jgi:uracil-DNA glycosylase
MAAAALAELREESLHCRNCPLWADATQTVFGEGTAEATTMFVGEAPGDQEDRQGRPFVGPAGQLFDRALVEAGIDRGQVYVTNAVKHFKFELRGKRRIHQKPDRSEIEACKIWLFGEIEQVRPRLIVAMGATAAQSLIGRTVTIGRERGRFVPYPPDRHLFVTVHPSFLLRVPDERARAMEYRRFLDELRMIAEGPREHAAAAPAEGPAGARDGKAAAGERQQSLF